MVGCQRDRPRCRHLLRVAGVALGSAALLGACDTTEQALREPLPSIATTTSTTSTPTTTLPPGTVQLYTVQSGDTLSGIAAAFNVTMDAVIEANNMSGTQVNVGATLNIPVVIVVDELPTTTAG